MLIHLFCLQQPAEILKHRAWQGWQCTVTDRQTLIKQQHTGMKGPARGFQLLQGPQHPHFLRRTKTQTQAQSFEKIPLPKALVKEQSILQNTDCSTSQQKENWLWKEVHDLDQQNNLRHVQGQWGSWGRKYQQAVVFLENFSFLWVPLLLISALHLFMKCIPVLTTSCAC